jgi:hypothetical protein
MSVVTSAVELYGQAGLRDPFSLFQAGHRVRRLVAEHEAIHTPMYFKSGLDHVRTWMELTTSYDADTRRHKLVLRLCAFGLSYTSECRLQGASVELANRPAS